MADSGQPGTAASAMKSGLPRERYGEVRTKKMKRPDFFYMAFAIYRLMLWFCKWISPGFKRSLEADLQMRKIGVAAFNRWRSR